MDRIGDSGSLGWGSIPHGGAKIPTPLFSLSPPGSSPVGRRIHAATVFPPASQVRPAAVSAETPNFVWLIANSYPLCVSPVGKGGTTLLSFRLLTQTRPVSVVWWRHTSAYFMFLLLVLGYFRQVLKLSTFAYIHSVSTSRFVIADLFRNLCLAFLSCQHLLSDHRRMHFSCKS